MTESTAENHKPSPVRDLWGYEDLVLKGQCVFCSSASIHEVSTRADGLTLKECMKCGLAFVDPRPSATQLYTYYDSGYFTGKKNFFEGKDYCNERDKALTTGQLTGFQEIVANFELEGKVILDIGCATGSLLYLLKSWNPQKLIGIDLAEYPVSYGVSRYNLDLRCTTLESAGLSDSFFDLVLMTDVIEHVENLPEFMSELRRVLKFGGYIYLITPNYSAFSYIKDQWSGLHKDFEHLQYFSPQSLDIIAAQSKFKLTKWWTTGLPFELQSYPKIYPLGLHRVLNAQVAIRNMVLKLWYAKDRIGQRDSGHNLHAILAG